MYLKGGERVASKRQRKKQQTKQNIKLLQSVGVNDRKKLQSLKNNPKAVKEVYKKQRRNIIANERSDYMRNVLGLKMDKENQRKRYWGEDRWNAFVNETLADKRKKEERERKRQERERRKLQDDQDLYLLIFWKEKTEGFADESIIEDFKHQYRHLPTQYIIDSINGFLTEKLPSLIGTFNIQVVRGSNRQATKSFMRVDDNGTLADWNSWLLVYEGKADLRRYKELLIAVHTVIRLLYDSEEKGEFLGQLINTHLPQVNKKAALRLAKDLNYRRGGF